ncbi:hypothetical protein PINS_up016765 [Pythium insidiosum]|nr:hypothetical protein PINS_up016765 [Pythium insidiosum]
MPSIVPASPTLADIRVAVKASHVQSYAWLRRVGWLTLVVVHLSAIAFNGVMIRFYWWFPGYTSKFVDVRSRVHDVSSETIAPIMYLLIGAAHALLLLEVVLASITQRRLAFRVHVRIPYDRGICPFYPSSSTLPATAISPPSDASTTESSMRCCTSRPVAKLKTALATVSAWLHLDFVAMQLLLMCRELFQSAFQTVQAYRMSHIITSTWLSHLVVLGLCCNCVSTPWLHRRFMRTSSGNVSVATQRVFRTAVLLVDLVLEGFTFWFIQLAILLPYWRGVEILETLFALNRSLTWIGQELQLGFPSTRIDMVARWTFAVIMLIGSRALQNELGLFNNGNENSNGNSNNNTGSDVAASSSSKRLKAIVARVTPRITPFVHGFFLAWGLVVLLVHVHAVSVQAPVGCERQLRKWFSPTPSCVVFSIDCVAYNTDGRADDIAAILSHVTLADVTFVALRHCQRSEIPERWRQLRSLQSMTLYNSTLAAWSQASALTRTLHPDMAAVTLARVQLADARLPDGLLSHAFPTKLKVVVVYDSNLAEVPEDLDERWNKRMTLFLELCALTAFPDALVRMDARDISLVSNRIPSLPLQELVGESRRLGTLSVSDNPIQEVPEIAVDDFPFDWWAFNIDLTNISVLPSWVVSFVLDEERFPILTASGSPVCDTILEFLAEANASTAADEVKWRSEVFATLI